MKRKRIMSKQAKVLISAEMYAQLSKMSPPQIKASGHTLEEITRYEKNLEKLAKTGGIVREEDVNVAKGNLVEFLSKEHTADEIKIVMALSRTLESRKAGRIPGKRVKNVETTLEIVEETEETEETEGGFDYSEVEE
jgi:hypothetical protein